MAAKKGKKRKKSFRRRAAGAARRVGRRLRRGFAKRPRMGLIGKTGVILAGGVPIGFGLVEAIDPWTNSAWAPYQLATKLKGSLAVFTNVLTSGFGLGTAVPAAVVALGDPLPLLANLQANVGAPNYAGAWLKTTSAGLGLVVVDGVVGVISRFAAGGRPRPRFMGRQLISG